MKKSQSPRSMLTKAIIADKDIVRGGEGRGEERVFEYVCRYFLFSHAVVVGVKKSFVTHTLLFFLF